MCLPCEGFGETVQNAQACVPCFNCTYVMLFVNKLNAIYFIFLNK